jgi:hypothetical protein
MPSLDRGENFRQCYIVQELRGISDPILTSSNYTLMNIVLSNYYLKKFIGGRR